MKAAFAVFEKSHHLSDILSHAKRRALHGGAKGAFFRRCRSKILPVDVQSRRPGGGPPVIWTKSYNLPCIPVKVLIIYYRISPSGFPDRPLLEIRAPGISIRRTTGRVRIMQNRFGVACGATNRGIPERALHHCKRPPGMRKKRREKVWWSSLLLARRSNSARIHDKVRRYPFLMEMKKPWSDLSRKAIMKSFAKGRGLFLIVM